MIRRLAMIRHTAVLTGLAVVAGCGGKKTDELPPVVRPVKTILVAGRATGEFTFPGIVDAAEKAVMSFRVSGRLVELPVEEGQEIPKGRLIGRLDPRDFEISVSEARAEFTRSEADLDRYQRLYENDAVPLADLQAARASRDVARARLDEAKRNLSYATLAAPFSGRVGRRYVENHMDVVVNQEIIDLNDVSRVEIEIDVSGRVIRGLSRTDLAHVVALFDNAPEREYPLEFKEAANRADPATQTFAVKFTMPQPEEFPLLPGMTAMVRVRIEADQAEEGSSDPATTIPAIAVSGAEDNAPFVWVLESDMTVRKRSVTVGPLTGTDDVIVHAGLDGGEEVVVAGLRSLSEGLEVSRWQPE